VQYNQLWCLAYTYGASIHMSQYRLEQFARAYALAEQDLADGDEDTPQEFDESGRTYSEDHYCERTGP
jgi:hypothetical protein